MTDLIVRRLIYSVAAFLGVIVIAFLMLHLSGDPVALLVPPEATPEDLIRIRTAYGLDRPLLVQFGRYLSRLARGDLGHSYRLGVPVTELLQDRAAATLKLAGAAMIFAMGLGVPLGAFAATRRGSPADTGAMLFAVIGLSIPGFWLGLMFIILFGVTLGWLPISGYGGWPHLVMPSIVLGSSYAAGVSRLTRTSLLEVLAQDYVRTARAKGLAGGAILVRHALRNAALPILTLFGLDVGRVLGGSVIVESIFAWPGMGRLAVQAVLGRDFPIVQGTVIVGAAIFLAVSVFVDLLYGLIDPRLRRNTAGR